MNEFTKAKQTTNTLNSLMSNTSIDEMRASPYKYLNKYINKFYV
jgi:hypothetical protein